MKKFFFLALMAFLWLPATTWANEANEEFDDSEQEDYDNGTITSSSISLDYKILTVATSEQQSGAGTVELESVATSSASATIGALSIPHIIVHVELDESYTAHTYYYEVVGIAMGAFGGLNTSSANQTITSVTIPYTVTYLGEDEVTGTYTGCFTNCQGLTSVAFVSTSENPSQLETIGTSAFQNCTKLTSIDIPSSVKTIGSSAFQGCSGLASINFPSDSELTTISQSAFQNCTALTEVKLPESVSSLGNSEFRGCSSLKTVWMPGSIQLNGNVFRSCTSLSEIVLEGGPGENGGYESGEVFTDDNGEAITLYVETGFAPAYLASAWETDVENENSSNAVLSWNFLTYKEGINSLSCDEEGVYYATYYTDAVGEFGSDVTPYIVTGIESGEITMQSLTGYIPAGTGVLLTASASGDTYYYHPYGVTEATASVEGNMLYGSLTETTTTVDGTNDSNYYFYKLTLNSENESGSVGFYWGADEGAAFTSAAYKAWLAVPISSDGINPASYSFKKDEGDTTGISAVESASEKAVSGIYTIQGVRVSNMNQPGLYIVDGKKVLVK